MFQKQESNKQMKGNKDLIEYELKHYKNLYQQQKIKVHQLNIINDELLNLKTSKNEDQNQRILKELKICIKETEKEKAFWEGQQQRERKKLLLAQKNIEILQDQVKVLKQQINHKNNKIITLRQHINSITSCNLQNDTYKDYTEQIKKYQQQHLNAIRILTTQKEEEKQILCTRITKINEKYQLLSEAYKNLQCKFQSQDSLHKQQKEVLEIKLQKYDFDRKYLMEEISNLRNVLEKCQEKQQENKEQLNSKWWQINKELLRKVSELEQTIKKLDEEVQKLHHQIHQGAIKVSQLKQQNEQLKKQMAWYLQLIEQLKGDYITSQLQKQNVVRKLEAQKKQISKNSRITHQKQSSEHNKSICSQSRMTVYRLSIPDKTPNKLQTTIKTKKNKMMHQTNHPISEVKA